MQATVSVVLVAGSMMLARSLGNLENQDFGYEIEGRVLVALNRPPAHLHRRRSSRALSRRRGAAQPRCRACSGAGLALYNPLTDNWGELVLVAGIRAGAGRAGGRVVGSRQRQLPAEPRREAGARPLLQRRRQRDLGTVAVVNEAFVRRFFKSGEDPLDQHFGLDLPENVNTYRIVGIVRDAKFAGFALDRPARPMFYVPLAQTVDYANPMMKRLETSRTSSRGLLLVTNMPTGHARAAGQARAGERRSEPDRHQRRGRCSSRSDRSFDQQRAVASLAGLFGVVALVLAAIGLYGVTAYTVAQRTNEIGIRMALGADRCVSGAFRRVVVGLVLGLPLAVGAGYLLSAQLYGVPFWDPLALGRPRRHRHRHQRGDERLARGCDR